MSITSYMLEGAAEQVPPGRRSRRGRAVHTYAATPASETASIAQDLARRIPAEALAVYTGILPFMVSSSVPLDHQDFTGRWVLAGTVAVMAVLFAVGLYRREILARSQEFRWPLRRSSVVFAAVVAWVFVIPGSPFNSFDWYTPQIGAIGGIGANAALILADLWFAD